MKNFTDYFNQTENKMKIELKHLAPYLPYGLKGYNSFMGHDLVRNIDCGNVMNYVWGDTNSKPILRPLSDFTKEIEHNGEKFVPIQKISFVDGEFYLDEVDDIIYFNDTCGLDAYEVTRCYSLIEKLFEWHFDVFGLIEKGLALDMNTLDQ